MQVFVGGDDDGIDLGPGQQLAVVGGDEVGTDLGTDLGGAVGLDLGQADPFDLGMAGGDFATEQADAAAADDGEADGTGIDGHGKLGVKGR